MRDINTATKQELVEVPSISPTRAQTILDWREGHGPVKDMSELTQIPGFGERTVQRISEHFTVSGTQQPNEDEDVDDADQGQSAEEPVDQDEDDGDDEENGDDEDGDDDSETDEEEGEKGEEE